MSKWTIEYDNSDTSAHCWWNISDGETTYTAKSEEAADKLAALLNAADSDKPLAYRYSRNNGKTWYLVDTDPTDLMPDNGGIVVPLFGRPEASLSGEALSAVTGRCFDTGGNSACADVPASRCTVCPNRVTPCQNAAHMGEHACKDRSQCWEPCGELGHSTEHAVAVPEPIGWISRRGLQALKAGASPTIHAKQSGKYDVPIQVVPK